MIACLVGKDKVAMIGRTSSDPYNLWKFPIEALKKAGVNTDYVKIFSFEKIKKFPGIALIPVDKNGNNQIYVLPGVNNDFSPRDIEESNQLFENAGNNSGILAFSMELPLNTAVYSVKKANKYNMKVILDTGGINEGIDYGTLLNKKIFLIKPNEHESKILTGVEIKNMATAKHAAKILVRNGIENVFITAGRKGGYLFNQFLQVHIPVPVIKSGKTKDETGCGDQTMATLCAAILKGKDILESARLAILAGTLQFSRLGISPVTKDELNKYADF
ncbi:MAG: hypothetical protein AUJ85_04600 [Elusimicrobia bacterium CG1_02_37_114]|nr:MAG: hypothetical protein AUJ85_04600 [Elusimicrobia bacterium CG1_02_37_114]PIV53500.1 MAG: hypothetical protein COS17_03545 [Elusimicrobia bacterium CG02_land_8_20_14_3_00_37_13]PIZ13013.1 MAG: hypothetical protein COY53_07065 [Elusimicrobia bacterium CG_4_10_14_0_8_um_filter_37_32]